MLIEPPGWRDALIALLFALTLVAALVVAARAISKPATPAAPHAAHPDVDVDVDVLPTQPDPTTTTLVTQTAETPPASEPMLTAAPSPLDNPDGFLACVRDRESGGDYTLHNLTGSGAAGAYQFMPDTWNATARHTGRDDLVDVDPAAATPTDQDTMARALYDWQGTAPWGGAC